MLDYIPLLTGLISAIIGVRGYTWDDDKKGLKRITVFGKLVVIIAVVSFAFSLYTIKVKNDQISDARKVAYNQIELGIDYILTPLKFDSIKKERQYNFDKIKDSSHLSKLFDQSILRQYPDLGMPNEYNNPYQIDSAYIQRGENSLNDALVKYSGFLDSKTIIFINDVLNNDFYIENYKFTKAQYFIKDAIKWRNDTTKSDLQRKKPPFSTYAFYYTNRITGHDTSKYAGLSSFIERISLLSSHIKNNL